MTQAKTPVDSPVELISQPHGGALLAGGQAGNRGGGRKPSAIRHACREITEESLPYLRAVIAGVAVEEVLDEHGRRLGLQSAKVADRVAAFRAVAQIGMSGRISADDVRVRLTDTIKLIEQRATWDSAELTTRLRDIWR